MTKHLARPSCRWRSLVDSPLLLATWAAVVLVCGGLFRTAGALGSAEAVRLDAAASLAHAAAETAAIRHLALAAAGGPTTLRIGDVEVRMQRDGETWCITSTVGNTSWSFGTRELDGAAPQAFAHPFSVVDPRMLCGNPARPVRAAALPEPETRAVAEAMGIEQCAAVRRDRGVALLTWETGTERDDFVFDPGRATADILGSREVVVVPGHLWLERGDEPLRLTLARDLVVVVRGNLYLGRSLAVEGPGRLVLAVVGEPGAPVGVDADGNGRWTVGEPVRRGSPQAGPPEGVGNVYFGLPGGTGPIVLDAAIVVGGEAHVRTESRVRGPVALAFGLTVVRGAANVPRLIPEGRWTFQVQRERVPGFVTSGGPRPALLVRRATETPATTEQTLYLSSPAR